MVDYGEKDVFLSARDGSLQSVKVTGQTGLFAIASWCNYSHQFIDTLNDPKLAKYMKNANLVFAFKDEINVGDAIEGIKISGGKALLYDEEMLEKLPGEYFFITNESQAKNQMDVDAYPRWFAPISNKFEKNVIVWFRDNLSIPEKEFFDVYQSHSQPPIKRF